MRKLLLAVAMMSSSSFAQTRKPEPKEIIFGEGDLIPGTIAKPDVEFIDGRPPTTHTSLIRVREDFKEKVMESAREL